jgi:hypothetical protein
MTLGAIGANWSGFIALQKGGKPKLSLETNQTKLEHYERKPKDVSQIYLDFKIITRVHTLTRRRLHSRQPWRDLR